MCLYLLSGRYIKRFKCIYFLFSHFSQLIIYVFDVSCDKLAHIIPHFLAEDYASCSKLMSKNRSSEWKCRLFLSYLFIMNVMIASFYYNNQNPSRSYRYVNCHFKCVQCFHQNDYVKKVYLTFLLWFYFICFVS